MINGVITFFSLIFFLTLVAVVVSTIWAIVNHTKKKSIKKPKLGIIISVIGALISFIVVKVESNMVAKNTLAIHDIKSHYVVKGKTKHIEGYIDPNSANPHIYLYKNGKKIGSDKPGNQGGFEMTLTPGKYKFVAENDYSKANKKFTVSKPKKTKAQLASESSKASSEKAAKASSRAAKESSQAVESSKKAAAKASSKAAAAASKASSKVASESSAEAYSASVASSEAYEKSPESYNTGVTYDQLQRDPDSFYGKKMSFSGEVLQALEKSGSTQLRLAVNGDYDNIILVEVDDDVRGSSRILENDYVDVYGKGGGTYTGKTVLGEPISIGGIEADIINDHGAAY